MTKSNDLSKKTLAEKLRESIIISDAHEINLGIEAFNGQLPEGLTPEIVAKVHQYEQTYLPAAMHCAGERAIDHMRGHADVNAMPVRVEFGSEGVMTFIVNRESTFMPPGGGQPIVSHGQVGSIAIDIPSMNRQSFKSTRDHLKTLGEKLLGAG